MSSEKSEAVVIRLADFSETSRVVTFFSEEFGKMSALAKGAKRLKSAFEGGIDLLSTCRIVFIQRQSASLNLLTEAKLVTKFTPSPGRLDSLYGGYYVAELLSLLTEDGDPHPQVYKDSLLALDSFRDDSDPGPALARFELRLLQITGHLPAFDACMLCGVSTKEGHGPWALWLAQGGVICKACQKSEYKSHPLQTGTLRVLEKLASDDVSLGSRINISKQQCDEIRTLTTSSITYLLGKRPRLMRYVEPRTGSR
jgi:DNA repair protein RecO (recombination protein O)